jgi:hypothetical protein
MKWPGMVELTRIDGTVRSQEVSSGGDSVAGSEAFGGPGARSAQGGPLHHRIPTVPFKHHAEHRHHIPKPRYRVTNWREYDAALRLRDSLTVWFTDEADRGVAGGTANHARRSAILLGSGDCHGADHASGLPPCVAPNRRTHRLRQ